MAFVRCQLCGQTRLCVHGVQDDPPQGEGCGCVMCHRCVGAPFRETLRREPDPAPDPLVYYATLPDLTLREQPIQPKTKSGRVCACNKCDPR